MTAGETSPGFWVADCWVQPRLSEVKKDDKTIQLEPKVMAVLELLASRPGEVFSRQDLEKRVWQGTIVGYDALSKAIAKLREALGDDKKQPQYIQTIPKKGYRLVAEVRSGDSGTDSQIDPGIISTKPSEGKSPVAQSILKIAVFAMPLLVLVLVGFYWLWSQSAEQVQPTVSKPDKSGSVELTDTKPIIVVLPFRNIGPHSGDAYLAEGITSDLITVLSRLSGLRVMASKAVFAYRNMDISPAMVKREFNARYLLTGEVSKVAEEIRINVHLTDVQQASILWAERYQRQFTDLFAIQDDVTDKIVQNLSLTLTKEERQRIARRYTHNLQAYEVFLRGQMLLNSRTPEDNSAARDLYRQAIGLDPGFARAYAGLAMTYAVGNVRSWPADHAKPLDEALRLSNQALQLDNDLPEILWVSGYVNAYKFNIDKAIDLLKQALALNPSFADAYAMLGSVYIGIGKPDVALQNINQAIRLNPAGGYLYQIILGRAHYYKGNYDLALRYFEKAYEINPRFIDILLYLAATYTHLGRFDDASWMLLEANQANPGLDTKTWITTNPFNNDKLRIKLTEDLSVAIRYLNQTR